MHRDPGRTQGLGRKRPDPGWTAIRAPGPGTAVRLSDPSGPLLHLGSPEAPRQPPRLSASQPRPAAGSHLCPTTCGASTSLCVNVTGRGGIASAQGSRQMPPHG